MRNETEFNHLDPQTCDTQANLFIYPADKEDGTQEIEQRAQVCPILGSLLRPLHGWAKRVVPRFGDFLFS